MGYAYMWPMRTPKSKYYKRHQQRVLYTGEKVSILETRFTWSVGLSPKPGPRGGKGFQPFCRSVYYQDGMFYYSMNVGLDSENTFGDRLFPMDGDITVKPFWRDSCRENGIPLAKIHCESGYPMFATLMFDDGMSVAWDSSDDWGMVESFLDLTCKKRKSPTKKGVKK